MMSASNQNNDSTLPQGFSVYQPTLGAQLQFFPALGTQELDEMINSFIVGPASTKEKRATVSLDFLEYAQVTGQTFKFYPVYSVVSPIVSSASASPLQDSATSSFNVSPVTSSWDWSNTSMAPSASPSSQSSTQRRRVSKVRDTPSRHQVADFAHLPGMKIMTKDGQDITNSASRGSKTKEQRDHAHLMRIIKACDSCKRKKIRCDPSHKKRAASQSQAAVAPQPAKKQRVLPQSSPLPPPAAAKFDNSLPPVEFDPSFTFGSLEDNTLDFDGLAGVAWDDFVQYPSADISDNYDFLFNADGYPSSQSSLSASPLKSPTPMSQQESDGLSESGMFQNPSLQTIAPQLPFDDQHDSANSYLDFNLFSPSSSFSEDEHMVSIGSSSSRVSASPTQQPSSGGDSPVEHYASHANMADSEWPDAAAFTAALQSPGVLPQFSDGSERHDSINVSTASSSQPGITINATTHGQGIRQITVQWPSGSLLVSHESGGHVLDSATHSSNTIASASIEVASESLAATVSENASRASMSVSPPCVPGGTTVLGQPGDQPSSTVESPTILPQRSGGEGQSVYAEGSHAPGSPAVGEVVAEHHTTARSSTESSTSELLAQLVTTDMPSLVESRSSTESSTSELLATLETPDVFSVVESRSSVRSSPGAGDELSSHPASRLGSQDGTAVGFNIGLPTSTQSEGVSAGEVTIQSQASEISLPVNDVDRMSRTELVDGLRIGLEQSLQSQDEDAQNRVETDMLVSPDQHQQQPAADNDGANARSDNSALTAPAALDNYTSHQSVVSSLETTYTAAVCASMFMLAAYLLSSTILGRVFTMAMALGVQAMWSGDGLAQSRPKQLEKMTLSSVCWVSQKGDSPPLDQSVDRCLYGTRSQLSCARQLADRMTSPRGWLNRAITTTLV